MQHFFVALPNRAQHPQINFRLYCKLFFKWPWHVNAIFLCRVAHERGNMSAQHFFVVLTMRQRDHKELFIVALSRRQNNVALSPPSLQGAISLSPCLKKAHPSRGHATSTRHFFVALTMRGGGYMSTRYFFVALTMRQGSICQRDISLSL